MTPSARKQRGFTLGESLIALAILAIAAAMLIPVFGAGTRLAAAREQRFRLHHAAQQALAALSADVAAGMGDLSRERDAGGVRLIERAQAVSVLEDGGQTLYRVTVTAVAPAGGRRNEATLTDYVVMERGR